jgi:hypothetical protein
MPHPRGLGFPGNPPTAPTSLVSDFAWVSQQKEKDNDTPTLRTTENNLTDRLFRQFSDTEGDSQGTTHRV